MKRFGIVSDKIIKTKHYHMLPGMCTYYHRGSLIPYYDKSDVNEVFTYKTKESAIRALRYAKKYNVFAKHEGYEASKDTFVIIELNF